jgi:NAD(P)-dependent dehydrogenase (short-subunit alcohol dehydrogenase family)
MRRHIIADKIAVVTGAANGIGAATARALIEAGGKVVLIDIDAQRGASLADSLGADATFVAADVRCESDIKRILDDTHSRFGRVDIMCNNAGALGPYSSITALDEQAIDASFALLFKSVVWGIKHAARHMKNQGRGSIINTASIASMQAGFGPHAYTAAKHAVLGLTRSAAAELAKWNIRVNALCPGGTLTNLALSAVGEGEDAEIRARAYLESLQPIQRAGAPQDMAEAILFLASDASSFMTGQALVVDGGATLGKAWVHF